MLARGIAALAAGLLFAAPAFAHPQSDLEVGDPLEAEVRLLDLARAAGAPAHSGTRPLLRASLLAAESTATAGDATAIAWRRIGRALDRERGVPKVRGATPWLMHLDEEGGARFDVSAGIEGTAFANPDTVRLADRFGLHVRGTLGFDRWIAQAHWIVGQVDSARQFADPIVARQDLLATVDQALIGYRGAGNRWGARLGRSRWHWGPGREGSLLLSKTAAPLTSFEFDASFAHQRIFFTALSATLSPAAGRQLAAHRVEWLARDGLRLGVAESAVYQSSGWRPLYLIGLLPYTTTQRIDVQDERSAAASLRNNVMVSADAAWRLAPGTRVYGEFLVDDIDARSRETPDKLGFQLGWDGLGRAFGRRVWWNGEYTRLSRWVYTSFFGAEASAQGRPLGFPTGPDARRLSLIAACDPSEDWQLALDASHTDKGENDLGKPFRPGVDAAGQDGWKSPGVHERTRTVGAKVRWWPASGIDLALHGGYAWRENAGHVSGRDRDGGEVSVEMRLTR